ncbi:MAG: aminomethyl-transferring glycine dehydrogenase subunit GcvPA [Chromatiales bacterium]|jgi:glycine dehydrogenase subunit 1|nr:aminomethyl-transferring glycine dehydrogenase subunit GcvPA [Chromatiales bacterium]MDH3932401.1 aminomethyl-transferring glycine dehydrogenase subunit GcvPA [Chromatiales bacterium]MDH4012654.1 aminomethyl-transferring glycine dehydrogenase subunit GcvPA [Chromatiales bacterium]PLX55346.1 MAG: aminomethyl-transferring glycine dehydrogenase [Chromatiales bacterium]
MAFIPHTEEDIAQMLAEIGVDDIEDLFSEIPAGLKAAALEGVPAAVPEMAITRTMRQLAARDGSPLSFLGGGAYEHHIPAAVWEVTTRGEFYSAYTPYQAEASQGTLQLIYEFQSMITALTALDVSNASLYDGASALAEASLMAIRANRKSKSATVLVPRSVNPRYLRVAESIAGNQGVTFAPIDFDPETGTTPLSALASWADKDVTALVVPQPNFFGRYEDVDGLTDWAHAHGALAIGLVNPTSLALLKPPGEWGGQGADIACGEGQPLGVPLSSGGPYLGFMACKKAFVRQMPGRIVGRTVDLDGKSGFTLTLQAREQHIRRSKATSNICTNQGLVMTAATIYMSLLGASGLARVAAASCSNTSALVDALSALDGVESVFSGAGFHEAVLRLDRPVQPVLDALAQRDILGGIDLGPEFPELGHCMLICATETKTDEDIRHYARALADILQQAQVA